MSSYRPTVQRKYGRPTSVTSPPRARPSKRTYGGPRSSTASSSSPRVGSSPRKRKDWTNTVPLAWADMLRDTEDESGSEPDPGHETAATTPDCASPPRSHPTAAADSKEHPGPTLSVSLAESPSRALRPRPPPSPVSGGESRATSKGKTKAAGDIRSFFAPSTAAASTSRPIKRARTSESSATPQPQAHQLLLDISNRPSTRTCPACGMSYVLGVPEDSALHEAHHKRVVAGIEWPLDAPGEGVTVVDVGAGGDQIIVVHLAGIRTDSDGKTKSKSLLRPMMKRKVVEVLDMVDTALGATPLSVDQMAEAKAFVCVGPAHIRPGHGKRDKSAKSRTVVKAVCVAARIEQAFKVIRSTDVAEPQGAGISTMVELVKTEQGDEDCLRFGEDDCAVFCSPEPYTALLGIHRIYTLPSYRSRGLATTLLTTTADRFVHGLSLADPAGRTKVAFSQPTRSGRALARRWTGTEQFGVFVD